MRNRVFFPQAALDEWLGDDRVDLKGEELVLKSEGRRYKIIEAMQKQSGDALPDNAARNFGVTLIGIGIIALAGGIIYDLAFMYGLRRQRRMLASSGNLHDDDAFPISFNLVLAVLLLLVGIFAILSIAFRAGPFI